MNTPQNTPQNRVDMIIRFLEDWERLPLAIVTMLGPWLTPLVPAYFVAVSVQEFLKAPLWMAVIAGIVLEVVGIAGIALSTRGYVWEKTRRKTDEPAQLWLSIGATSIYFITSLVLTVVLEFFEDWSKGTPGMFVVMGVSSGLILVLSGLQNRREKAVRQEKSDKRRMSKGVQQTVQNGVHLDNGNMSNSVSNDLSQDEQKKAILDAIRQQKSPNWSSLARHLGVSRSTIYNRRDELEEAGFLRQNGQGWIVQDEE